MPQLVTLGIRGKLLLLLLGFGVIPLGVSVVIGYTVSRSVMTRQAEDALRELSREQAVHVAAELSRQRLLLRTSAGQLPEEAALRQTSPVALSRQLFGSLPQGGVFEGLRLVTSQGRVLASVALRGATVLWPPRAPAANWTGDRVVMHREAGRVLAYVIAVPATSPPVSAWLEGHVRAQDFNRIFSIPEHPMTGVEAGLFDRSGEPILVAHDHAAEDLGAAFVLPPGDSVSLVRATVAGIPSLIATAPVAHTDWVLIAFLPVRVALAPFQRLRDAALVAGGLLILLIVVTAAIAARSVTTPLQALAEAARHLGREEGYAPLEAHGSDEVGRLVEDFNRMAEDLRQSRLRIDQLHAQGMARAQQLATVGELASGVAHEIRNPVTAVLGALDLALRRLPPGESARPFLEEAQKQLKRIETTTTQLLRYARPPELREVVVEANLLVERAARIVEAQARSAGAALKTEPAPGPVPVRVDPELMVQVLVNLMLNGIEAMGPGGHLTLWVTRHAPDVWIGVRDTGPGVPPENRAEIFRPFYTTKHQGTGLGLSISHQIVTRHGGSLRIEDTPGGGATFVVALPLADGKGAGHGVA